MLCKLKFPVQSNAGRAIGLEQTTITGVKDSRPSKSQRAFSLSAAHKVHGSFISVPGRYTYIFNKGNKAVPNHVITLERGEQSLNSHLTPIFIYLCV